MALLGKIVKDEGWCLRGWRDGQTGRRGWKPRGGYLETAEESEQRASPALAFLLNPFWKSK